MGVVLNGFVGVILSLQQKRVARDALRWLLAVTRAQKPVVDGHGLCLVFGLDEQIKKHPVIHCRALRLVLPRIEVAKRLRGFLMLRCFVQNREISLDRILDAVLLEEALGAFQMLADVCGHPFELPLRYPLFAISV